MNYKQAASISESMNESNDCTVIALAIATESSYQDAHKVLSILGRKPRHGMNSRTIKTMMQIGAKMLGRVVDNTPTYPTSTTMATVGERYPHGRWLVICRGHIAALVDGQVQDWTAGRKHRVKMMLRVGV